MWKTKEKLFSDLGMSFVQCSTSIQEKVVQASTSISERL